MEGRMTIAMNTHQEVCVLQLTGGVAILPDQVCWMYSERESLMCVCSLLGTTLQPNSCCKVW